MICNWIQNSEYEDQFDLEAPYYGTPTNEAVKERVDQISLRKQTRMQRVYWEQRCMIDSIAKVGLGNRYDKLQEGTARDFLLDAMTEQIEKMSAPGRAVVEVAGPWWRDTGKGVSGYDSEKYTVDLFGVRRGGSKMTGCAWYRWDETCILRDIKDGYVPLAVRQNEENFRCWWCGGLPGEHEDLGPASQNEEPTYFPGLGVSKQPWRRPRVGVYEEPEEEQEDDRPSHLGAPFQRVNLNLEGVEAQPQDDKWRRIQNAMKPRALLGKSGTLIPVAD